MKIVRVAFVLIVVPWWLIFQGCFLDGIGGGKNISHMEKTPAGWRVEWKDRGLGLHTKAEMYALLDAAMVRAAGEVARDHGVAAASVLARARNGGAFILIDDWHFPTEGAPVDFPGTAWATGEIDGGSNITVAFFARAGGTSGDAATIPASAIGVYQGPQTGFWYWGVEVDGWQFPALAFELAHEWGF